jgi:hypothetical protein
LRIEGDRLLAAVEDDASDEAIARDLAEGVEAVEVDAGGGSLGVDRPLGV